MMLVFELIEDDDIAYCLGICGCWYYIVHSPVAQALQSLF